MTSANDDDTSGLDDDWDLEPPAPAAHVSGDAPSPSLQSAPENHAPLSSEPSAPPPDATATATAGADESKDSIGGSPAKSPPESFERGDVIEPAASPPGARRFALAAVVAGVLAVGAITVRAVVTTEAGGRLDAPISAAASPAAIATTPAVSATTPPALPTATTSQTAEPPPTTEGAAATAATASSGTEPEPRPTAAASQRFDPRAARTALDALAPTLTDCRIPKGRSGKVEVIFEPDGHISSAKPLDLYVGTFGGKCVARHLTKASVPPFSGQATAHTHVFIIPE